MTSVLFAWPAPTLLNKPLPKTHFYRHANITSALKAKFVDNVNHIDWTAKLAQSTLRLAGSEATPEIQVFTVVTKGADLDASVLATIDKSVQYPIVFEVRRGEGSDAAIRMTAAQKTLGGGVPKLGTYFTTEWISSGSERRPLPIALDLPTLYEAIFATILPAAPRPGESVSAAADRMKQSEKLRREIDSLQRKLRTEPQLNRKIELRQQIRLCDIALIELIESV